MVRVIPMGTGQTALSVTAGTDTAMGGGNFQVPDWATSILGISVSGVTDLPTAAQSWLARTNLLSDNVGIGPFHAFAAPIGSLLGASGGGVAVSRPEKYDMNLRINGGTQITPNMRALVTNTSASYGEIMFVVSDATPAEAQRHIQSGTLTGDTVVNAWNDGTQYSISNARNIVELLGIWGGTTVATSEGRLGKIKFTANEFAGVNSADLQLPPVGGNLATLAVDHIDGVGRAKCNIPIQSVSACNIQDSLRMISSADIGATVNWCSAVVYEV